jgi:type I restriction enzyme R subunit
MKEEERFRRRDLPHWDQPGAAYFITCCLEGSIPAQGLLDIARLQSELRRRKPPPGMTQEDWQLRNWKLTFARIDQWLDIAAGTAHLRDTRLAAELMENLLHFAGEHYDLHSFVIMPSHFHWLFRPKEEWVISLTGDQSPRERIMKSVKSYSAKQCNRLLDVTGRFWQEESYDHWVRDAEEFERIMHYIEQNPVKAGLVERPEDWVYSSAYLRKVTGVEFGFPLRKK